MNRIHTPLLLVSMLILLPSCGMFQKNDQGQQATEEEIKRKRGDYLVSQSTAKMSLPEGIDSVELDPLYPIPDVSVSDEFGDPYDLVEYKVPRPEPVNSDKGAFGVKIQSLGDEKWIFVGAPTSQVWPRAQSFLVTSDVDVSVSDAELGLIETDWFQFTDDDSLMARFRISLEKGLHPDTTEIHIREIEFPMGAQVPEEIVWPEKSDDPAREEWLMRELAREVAASVDNASASLLGQNVGGATKAGYVRGASEPTMKLNLSQARAWATLNHAASQDGFKIWDVSEAFTIIYAGYRETHGKKRGFWKRVFTFGDSGQLPEKSKYSLAEILKHLSDTADARSVFSGLSSVAFGESLPKANPGFLIVLLEAGDHAEVLIRDHRGRKLPVRQAKFYLRLLRKNLI